MGFGERRGCGSRGLWSAKGEGGRERRSGVCERRKRRFGGGVWREERLWESEVMISERRGGMEVGSLREEEEEGWGGV